MKMHTDGSKDQGKLYEWQTSDGDKPGEGGAPFTIVHLIIAFLLSAGVGAFMMRF